MDPLNRDGAPFGPELWAMIDEAAVSAARSMLTARRFLPLEGPFGLGLTSVEVGADDFTDHPPVDEAVAVLSAGVAVPMLWRGFVLSLRRLAAFGQYNLPLDLRAVEEAAEAVARLEERLIYHGEAKAGLAGLLTALGSMSLAGGDWSRVDEALRDVLAAVTTLDESGFRGPYALVASPRLYNGLFRRYDNSDLLQAEHLSRLCTLGIHKAPIDGAAVLDPRVGHLILGQDMRTGFIHSDGIHCRLFISESLVLRLDDARAVCRIDMPLVMAG